MLGVIYPENANHYRNGFVTQTPDRQGKNQLIFDDSNGKEQVEISTTGNKIETINKTHQVTVGGKQSITIGENQETTVHENQHLTIKQDQELKIGGTQLTEVAKAIKLSSEQGGIELHSKKHTIIEAGESISFSAKKKIVLNAGETISLQVGTTHLTIDSAQLTIFPMMSLSKDTLPLTALTTSASETTKTTEETNTDTEALKINPDDMYWPPYNFLAKEGEQEIKVEYTQDVVEATVLAPEEWREFFQAIDITKNVGGAIKDTYDAVDTAKKLGGLGVTAYVKTHNGVDYLILKGYKQHLKTLLAGTRFKASNPQVVKLGLAALNSAKDMKNYVKITAPMEILVGSSINVLQYILNDEYTLKQLGVDQAKIFVQILVASGLALGAAALFPVLASTTIYSGITLVVSNAVVWTADKITDFENKLIKKILELSK